MIPANYFCKYSIDKIQEHLGNRWFLIVTRFNKKPNKERIHLVFNKIDSKSPDKRIISQHYYDHTLNKHSYENIDSRRVAKLAINFTV